MKGDDITIASMYPCPFDRQDRHEFNASVIKGEEIYSYEEGKCTTVKNEGTVKFPERSLMMGFKELNVTPDEVDKWVFPTPYSDIKEEEYYLFFSWYLKAYLGQEDDFKAWFDDRVEFVDHQISHAALAVYGSSFSECAFLCMDGGGDFGDKRGYVFGEYSGGDFSVKYSQEGSDTVANFHSFVTDAVGFSGDDNGKTSGLASYGKVQPELESSFNELIDVSIEHGIRFDRKRFNRTGVNLSKIRADSYDRTKVFNQYPSDTNVLRDSVEYLPHDVAATCEHVLRESMIKLVSKLKNETNNSKIVFSGGLFQNVALNKALVNSGFEDAYFPSAPSDAGLSLGGALYIKNKISHSLLSEPMSAYLGPSFKKSEVKEVLDRFRLNYSECENIAEVTAKLISEGNSVGWFQGRAEFGPRSLGARSLIADPRKKESKEKINQLLKKRDWFMPYAPSILDEYLLDWVDSYYYSPYMQVAFDVNGAVKNKIPSAVHVDGTSRFHVVKKNENELYWLMIDEFRKLTGVPMVLNTSFNRHGISTFSTPRQAVEHLMEGCMDYLVADNFIVSFKDNRIVTQGEERTSSESDLLKIGAVERLSVFNKHGTDNQMKGYLAGLSDLIGVKIEFVERNVIKWEGDEVLDIYGLIDRAGNKVKRDS